MARCPHLPRYFLAYPESWWRPLVLRAISPRQRLTNIITAPIVISQKSPTRKPDFAKMYGRPNIPAPIIVPVRVNVVAQNFLFMDC